jgi:branched-chain amino acid aminotransferase
VIVEPKPEQIAWIDGRFVAFRDATMHVTDHHYGVGVFEGVRAYAREGGSFIFRLTEHTRRLFRSAQILNVKIPEPYDVAALDQVQIELVRRNKLGDAYLRPFVFHAGWSGIRPSLQDLSVHVAVLAFEWKGRLSPAGSGVALRSTAYRRGIAGGGLVKAKANANYLLGVLAHEEARRAGGDDALLLDDEGSVTETSGSNLFVVRDGKLYTPPSESVLEGVTRDTVIALAQAEGLRVEERRMSREDVYVADEVFLTGTAMEVTPVRELDGRKIGQGAPGPVTQRLQEAYARQVLGRPGHRPEWLSRVDF